MLCCILEAIISRHSLESLCRHSTVNNEQQIEHKYIIALVVDDMFLGIYHFIKLVPAFD